MITATTRVNVAGLQKFMAGLQDACDEAVEESCAAIEEGARRNAEPYADTGSEVAGYFRITPEANDYPEAAANARAANPRVQIVPEPIRSNPHGGVVGNAAAHDLINEYGSVVQKRPARGMLRKAVEAERPSFPLRISRRVRKLADDSAVR